MPTLNKSCRPPASTGLPHLPTMKLPLSEGISTEIEAALELEYIDADLYRSRHLWLPVGARGVYGGQVVGLALAAATKTVPPTHHVHSLHSYFILPGDANIPIIYKVIRVRDGRTYVTRIVNASQKGKIIFSCICSFQTSEDNALDHQYEMPQAPHPDSIPSEEDELNYLLKHPEVSSSSASLIKMRLKQPIPIEAKLIRETVEPLSAWRAPEKRKPKQLAWMRAKGKLPDALSVHHCVAAYCSDYYLLNTSLLPHGITRFSTPRLQMIASLDHTIWFHEPFRADEWLLYEMESSRTCGGRGLTFGRIFTMDGRLVMSCAQEGVIRIEKISKGISDSPGNQDDESGNTVAAKL
ncbi:acyl-coenzyme A thioesterase 8-like protein [Polychytrium aggregatum]|uniref:acyl-coenzyme A thioesterase 8-like protein n=1 Tax=Polychytrium aggregatum TaxID=110093 RepID=UPI0022FE5FE4|nr:acyl-coenzyme A thioesterase 8-like protein [Polychytrium aggregatum]KAI9208163.1 acyl-coenzyme A thioesterase 8-like protein [Polychytrium aggregatum]